MIVQAVSTQKPQEPYPQVESSVALLLSQPRVTAVGGQTV